MNIIDEFDKWWNNGWGVDKWPVGLEAAFREVAESAWCAAPKLVEPQADNHQQAQADMCPFCKGEGKVPGVKAAAGKTVTCPCCDGAGKRSAVG